MKQRLLNRTLWKKRLAVLVLEMTNFWSFRWFGWVYAKQALKRNPNSTEHALAPLFLHQSSFPTGKIV